MLAPNQVSAPATIQTSSMPPKVGTALLTSDGCTKIEEPTIVPTTIAVACVSPIDRASRSVTGECYHRHPTLWPFGHTSQNSDTETLTPELRHRNSDTGTPTPELRHRNSDTGGQTPVAWR